MVERIKSGFRGRPNAATLIAAEFRAQALGDQVRDLTRDLIRLRAAARDYLCALPPDQSPALARLRHELAKEIHPCRL